MADQTTMRTPADWAERLGYITPGDPNLPQKVRHAKWEHAAADALYGWSAHAFHYQAPSQAFLITEETYREALRIAAVFPNEAPSQAALPESQRPRFAKFQARATSEAPGAPTGGNDEEEND